MQYEADRLHDKFGEPSLAEMIQKTIAILSKNPKGYVIIAEGEEIMSFNCLQQITPYSFRSF